MVLLCDNQLKVPMMMQKFYDRIEDVEKPLYKGCTKFSIFSAIVVLYHLKTLCGWTNKSFTLLLQVLHDLLPLDV